LGCHAIFKNGFFHILSSVKRLTSAEVGVWLIDSLNRQRQQVFGFIPRNRRQIFDLAGAPERFNNRVVKPSNLRE